MMPAKKVSSVALMTVFIVALVLAVANTANVRAQYYYYAPLGGSFASIEEQLCGSRVGFQVRLFNDTPAYADPNLSQFVTTLVAQSPDRTRSKWLVCENSLNGRAWAIFFVDRLLWIPSGSGEVVPRQFRDDQR